MLEIAKNLLFFVIWLALTVVLVWGIHTLTTSQELGPAVSVVLWLLGQCVILSPLLWFIWSDRKTGMGERA